MLLAQPSWARICLNTLFVFRYIYVSMIFDMLVLRSNMFPCFLPGLCLDLYVYALLAMFMCLDLYVGCYVIMSLVMPFSCALALRQEVNLDLVVLAYVHTSRPITKGLDHFLYACVCLFSFILQIHVCLPRSRLLPCFHCFVPSMGLCLFIFGTTCLFGCIRPSYSLFGCNHL